MFDSSSEVAMVPVDSKTAVFPWKEIRDRGMGDWPWVVAWHFQEVYVYLPSHYVWHSLAFWQWLQIVREYKGRVPDQSWPYRCQCRPQVSGVLLEATAAILHRWPPTEHRQPRLLRQPSSEELRDLDALVFAYERGDNSSLPALIDLLVGSELIDHWEYHTPRQRPKGAWNHESAHGVYQLERLGLLSSRKSKGQINA